MKIGPNDVLAEIRTVAIDQLNMTEEQIAAIDLDAPLLSSLPLDSLGQVVLATSIEAKFGIQLEPEEWAQAQTIRSLTELIAAKVSGEVNA